MFKKGKLITTLDELVTYPQDTYMWLTYNGKTKFGQFYWITDEGAIIFYNYNAKPTKTAFMYISIADFRQARLAEYTE